MVNSAIAEEISSDLGLQRRIQPTYGYYRQRNGWITVSPITREERIRYQERGWTHLAQYGAFDMNAYGANHPLEALFMFGGASELPVEQVIQMGLYFDSPLVPRCKQHITQFHRAHNKACWQGAQPVVFPQMADVPPARIGPFPCEFCDRRLPTTQSKEQHQSVVHREQLGNINTGKSLGTSLAEALGRTVLPTQPPSVSPEMQEMQRTISSLQAQVKKQGQSKPRSRSRKKVLART